MDRTYVDLTIHGAARLLAEGALSSLDLVEATLQRIKETEGAIHAYAVVLADQAREAAWRADQERARDVVRGPLHGIPIGVKDICATRGIPTGLPIGVQLLGRPFGERTVFRLGRAYERVHDWAAVRPSVRLAGDPAP